MTAAFLKRRCADQSIAMKNLFHRMFDIGVWTKGINGTLEVAGGLLALTVKKSTAVRVILLLTQQELIEDPHDVVANLLRYAVEHITTNSKMFGGMYLIAHGATSIFLAVQLLRKRLWSYLAAIAFLCVFIGYQIYRITLHHSLLLTIVTGLDVVIVILIRHEYLAVKGEQV
jgi:uncharacterized membrane protein